MPGVIALGTLAQSADPVVTPTNLVPGMPGTLTAGDWLCCYTCCTSATPTVATPAGWQSVLNVTGTNGRMALFARKYVGGDTAPTVAWSTLTTGLSGTPCLARIVNMGIGFGESAGNLIVDVLGAVSNQAASTTVMAGGAAVTTLTTGSILFSFGVRLDDAATGISDSGTGVTWNAIWAEQSTSGTDMLAAGSWALAGAPIALGAHTFTLTGGTSVASSGVTVALKPTVDAVPALTHTRSRVRMRPSY